MNFTEALKAMQEGNKVKLPSWGGYWCWSEEEMTVLMHTKDGHVLDILQTDKLEYTIANICSNDWVIATDSNTPILGGENKFNFGEAIKYLKRGFKVARKGWNGIGIYLELQLPDENSKMTLPYIYIVTDTLLSDNPDAPKGKVPWVASQTDILAEDWIFV